MTPDTPKDTPAAAVTSAIPFLLHFTGLCTFVPRFPVAQQENHVTVLMVDAKGGDAHDPMLVCRNDFVDAGGRQPDKQFVLKGQTYALFLLRDQHVTFQPPANKLRLMTGKAASDQHCPTAGDWDDVHWIAPMARIMPGSEVIKDGCLDPGTNPAFAARLELSQGTMACSQLARDGSGTVVIWKFVTIASDPGDWKQALADHVTLSTTVDTEARLTSTLIRTTSDPTVAAVFGNVVGTPKTIILTDQVLGSPIEAVIKNVPMSDALGTTLKPLPTPRDPDEHFAHFYDLSVSGPSSIIPYPDLTAAPCAGADVPSLRTVFCPPSIAAA